MILGNINQEYAKVTIIAGKLINVNKEVTLSFRQNFDIGSKYIKYGLSLKPDSTFVIKFELQQAQAGRICNEFIFCEPGDSVFVTIKGNGPFPDLHFENGHAPQYNFFIELDKFKEKRNLSSFLINDFPNSLEKLPNYKRVLNARYTEMEVYLNNYVKKYKCTPIFKNYAYAQIHYEYLSLLILKYLKLQNSVPPPPSYFFGVTPTSITNDKYLLSPNYFQAIFKYTINLFVKNKQNDPSDKQIDYVFNFIRHTYKGLTRDVVLAEAFEYYFNKKDHSNFNKLLAFYNQSPKWYVHKNFYTVLYPLYLQCASYNFPLNTDSLTNIERIDGLTSPISELVKANAGKILYIDFWASWCSPCNDEMPYSFKLQNEYKLKNFQSIYLSIDKDSLAWKKSFIKLNMDTTRSFLLSKGLQADISKKIVLKLIPRYILIGKDGKIIDPDAPRPSDSKLKTVLNILINDQK